jgi:hypothetical protein
MLDKSGSVVNIYYNNIKIENQNISDNKKNNYENFSCAVQNTDSKRIFRDFDYFDELQKLLICNISNDILYSPFLTKCCGNTGCYNCFQSVKVIQNSQIF